MDLGLNGMEIPLLVLWVVGVVFAVHRLRRERSISSWTVLVLAAVVPVIGSLVAIAALTGASRSRPEQMTFG